MAMLPRRDNELLAFSLNLATLISATPGAYGLSPAQAAAYLAVHTAYATALAACDPAIRNKTSTAAKNAARAALERAARQTAATIDGTPAVTDAQKIQLGLLVRRSPQVIPAPTTSPGLEILSQDGWTVSIRLRDKESLEKRGKPAGVAGASVFSFVGDTPPSNLVEWNFQGNIGRTTMDITFPSSLPPGTKVWITAFWFNGRKQAGPNCAPESANLPGGSVSQSV